MSLNGSIDKKKEKIEGPFLERGYRYDIWVDNSHLWGGGTGWMSAIFITEQYIPSTKNESLYTYNKIRNTFIYEVFYISDLVSIVVNYCGSRNVCFYINEKFRANWKNYERDYFEIAPFQSYSYT